MGTRLADSLVSTTFVLASACVTPRLRLGDTWSRDLQAGPDAPLLTIDFGLEQKVANETILLSSTLTHAEEQQLVALNQGRGVLLPFGAVHSASKLVVLVHGRNGLAGDFERLLDRLSADPAKQVCVFLYDDLGKYLDRAGAELAAALVKLQATFFKHQQPKLEIIAHSMGGVVGRSALNALVQPNWFTPQARLHDVFGLPPANSVFQSVRLIAIDTPWHGFGPAPPALRTLLPFETSLVDLTSTSPLLARVNRIELPPTFSMHLVEADQRAAGLAPDAIKGLGDLNDDDTFRVERSLLGTAPIDDRPDLQNELRALEASNHFARLQRVLREQAGTAEFSRARFQDLLVREGVISRFAGSHRSVLENPDLIEAIALETLP
jgi:pimeloyl-ACP methyl ester carboxylesterase